MVGRRTRDAGNQRGNTMHIHTKVRALIDGDWVVVGEGPNTLMLAVANSWRSRNYKVRMGLN